jgi:copper(I)-binding protein
MINKKQVSGIVLATFAAASLAACGGSDTATDAATSAAAAATSAAASAASSAAAEVTGDATSSTCPITVSDAWVKAVESGMTGEFGVLKNTSDAEVVITAGTSSAASSVELHEVVDGTMTPVQGGFTVPANGELTLEPGGYHVMLMGVTAPIQPGNEVTTTLECSDGGTFEMVATAKEYSGADESYAPSMDMGSESGMAEDQMASPSAN